jgi:DNA-binding MarR family transcriptional regulator
MEFEQLKLENQICFPLYAASRLITKEYQPYLDELHITYPQYLVLLVLWETDKISVNEIAHRLLLNTNTITPLLKRMEADGILQRTRSDEDERKVIIQLTVKGLDMKLSASEIPAKLTSGIKPEEFSLEELVALKGSLEKIIKILTEK